jgi:hypothetical protein
MVEDAACQRIRELVATELQQVAVSEDGWEKLYRDQRDGRLWEWFYPQSEMHGGDPPALRVVSPETADGHSADATRWRRPIGTLLILTPLLALSSCAFTGILLGSMGIDIHFNSKAASYVAITCTFLVLLACVATGIRLRKRPNA